MRKIEDKAFTKSLGQKIRALRIKKGWALEETEEHGWASWRHLQKIESGKNITLQTLVKLANLFGIHPSDLLKDL